MPLRPKLDTNEAWMRRCPRLTAHLICHSLGYATPSCAARILSDAAHRRSNWCEWLDACYRGNAVQCVHDAIRGRHGHHGYMAEYTRAYALVRQAANTGNEPAFASWF